MGGLVEEITERVHTVSEELAWELGPGVTAEHQLVVTAGGNPAVRALARRWLLAAPPADATWEYADAKRADADVESMALSIGDDEVAFGEVRVRAERVGNHVDVEVFHPAMATLPEQVRNTVAFVALDSALGEIDCETWIGAVDVVLDPPAGAVPLAALLDVVADVRADALTDDGDPVWVLLSGEHEGRPVMAAAMVPLAPSWAPHLDLHLGVEVPYAGRTEAGLPDPASLDALRALEDQLGERLGDSATLVAHETSDGLRLLHLYADSTGPAVGLVETAVTGWAHGEVVVDAEPDPGWHAVRHLRT